MLRYGLETTTRLILRVPQDQGLLDWWSKKRRLYYYIQRSSSNKIIVVKTFFCARIRCCFFTHACTRYKTKIESQHSHTHPDSPTFFVVTVSLVICHNVSSNICNFSFHSTIKSMNIINFEKKKHVRPPALLVFLLDVFVPHHHHQDYTLLRLSSQSRQRHASLINNGMSMLNIQRHANGLQAYFTTCAYNYYILGSILLNRRDSGVRCKSYPCLYPIFCKKM